MRYTTVDTKFDPSKQPIPINAFSGSYDNPKARIWPLKRMHTYQPCIFGARTKTRTGAATISAKPSKLR